MISRRDFIKSSLAFLASCYCVSPKRSFAMTPRTKAVILLWMGGGMAHTETFDPKEYRKFDKGVLPIDLHCTFPSIPTSVDGLYISEGLENIASIMDRGFLLRSLMTENLGNVLHSRYQYLWHTGYSPPLTLAAPHIGAWISYIMGRRVKGVPPFVEIGQSLNHLESNEIKDFLSGGCLGVEYAPLSIPDPRNAIEIFMSDKGLGDYINRLKLSKELSKHFGNEKFEDAISASIDNAHDVLMSPMVAALDINKESPEKRNLYGNSKFASGCLLARRLVEAGVRFVEVSSDFIPFKSWDTHYDGHRRTKKLKSMIDMPVTQLILDLEERGLLNETLVILASEFSRDAVLEGSVEKPTKPVEEQPNVISKKSFWGLHRHFIGASSVLMFGGGIKQGTVFGRTAERRPCSVIEDPVALIDLHATIYHALGIPADTHVTIDKRPFYVTRDGKGKVIESFFS